MFLFILFFTLAYCETSDCGNGETFSREQAWSCAMNVVDINHDQAIDGPEIEAAKAKYLYWYERTLGWIIGPTRVEAVMLDCDANGDNKVDHNDYQTKKLWCMPYMDPRKNWETRSEALCRVKSMCDRAAKKLKKAVY